MVEVVPAPWTEESVIDKTVVLMKELGQAPVRLYKEVNGFVINRLQYALIMEAWSHEPPHQGPSAINGPPTFTVLTTRAWYKILMMDSQQINGCTSLQISEVHGTGSNMRRRPIASNKQCKCKVENELTITMAYKTIHTHCGN